MPINIEVIKQGRVALQTYIEPLTVEDLEALNDQMRLQIMSGAIGKVHILADFRQVQRLSMSFLMRGSLMLDHTHPNTGTIVGIITSPVIYRLALMFANMAPKQAVFVVKSFDEAMNIVDDLLADDQGATP